jgi:Domain of unknown function (DUF4157)
MSSPEKSSVTPAKKVSTPMLGESSFESEGVSQLIAAPAFQLMASDGNDGPPIQRKESRGGMPGDLVSGFAASTGHDLSDVKVHYNSDKPSQVGALAYAQGNDIHLGTGQEQHLAHEAAHVVQQREGRVQATSKVAGMPVNDNKGLESEADNMGAKAMQMKSATPPTQLKSSSVSGLVGQHKSPIQRFKDFSAAGENDSKGKAHWAAKKSALRVTEDGQAAVGQEWTGGGQELYIDESRQGSINGALITANTPFRLVADGATTVEGALPTNLEGSTVKKLKKFKPVEAKNAKVDKLIPDDCGNAARTVSGAFNDRKQLKAYYQDKNGAKANANYGDPELMKYEIMVNHFGDKIAKSATIVAEIAAESAKMNTTGEALKPHTSAINAIFAKIKSAKEKVAKIQTEFTTLSTDYKTKIDTANASADPKKDEMVKALQAELATKTAAIKAKLDVAVLEYKDAMKEWEILQEKNIKGKKLKDVLSEYWAARGKYEPMVKSVMDPYYTMAEPDREAFDKKIGINRFANPKVGEAYTMSSGGANKKKSNGEDERTWNFHWGGIAFKSTNGADNVTLENYAGSRSNEWVFQVYGVPTADNERKGQTFQEQHRDTHRQHGETPTTLATEKK